MNDWVQLGDGRPWYRELDSGEIQFCADGAPVSSAIGLWYDELDTLPRYATLLAGLSFLLDEIEYLRTQGNPDVS